MRQPRFKTMTNETKLFIREKFEEASKREIYAPYSDDKRDEFELAYVDHCMINSGRRVRLRRKEWSAS